MERIIIILLKSANVQCSLNVLIVLFIFDAGFVSKCIFQAGDVRLFDVDTFQIGSYGRVVSRNVAVIVVNWLG